jgi:hypothetical protein
MQEFLDKNMLDFQGIKACDFDKIVRRRTINWIQFSKELFGEFGKDKIYDLLACGATLNGVFKVSKNAILKNDLSIYKKALKMVSRVADPHEGYFLERMWKYLFIETGCKDKNYLDFNNKILKFGTMDRKTKTSKTVAWKDFNYGHIKFSEDGTIRSNGNISYYSHPNESHWLIRENALYLLDANGSPTSRFKLNNNIEKDNMTFSGEIAIKKERWAENALILSQPFWEGDIDKMNF